MSPTIEEIKAALDAATPGPWDSPWSEDAGQWGEENVAFRAEGEIVCGVIYYDGPRLAVKPEDAHLIANAPTWLAVLLAEVERLGGILDAYSRQRADNYIDWARAGGPNECVHGRAEGIHCPHCDLWLIREFEAR